jgi:capsular polysaccharide export protein
LTSLTGFEALLRDCEVVTHGYPFYAGWGLTHDLAPPIDRRQARTVSRAELVAAALILYPRYLDPVTKLPCPPEVLIERLAAQPVPQETLLTRLRKVQGRIRRGLAGARIQA